MRQVGVIAAAGIVALDNMVERLNDDHANARRLAQGLAQIPGIDIDPDALPHESRVLHHHGRRPGADTAGNQQARS